MTKRHVNYKKTPTIGPGLGQKDSYFKMLLKLVFVFLCKIDENSKITKRLVTDEKTRKLQKDSNDRTGPTSSR